MMQQDIPFITTCDSFNEAARALRYDTPYYAAMVTNKEITALHQELTALWESKELTEDIEWVYDRRPARRMEYLQPDELPGTQQMLRHWRAMTHDLFSRNFTTIRNTGGLPNVQGFHIDPDMAAFLTTGDTTEFITKRLFRWKNEGHAIETTAADVANTFSPPRGQAIVLATKFDNSFDRKYTLGHRAPPGDRLQVLAYDRFF